MEDTIHELTDKYQCSKYLPMKTFVRESRFKVRYFMFQAHSRLSNYDMYLNPE
jgi:hypothetical protein